MTQPAETKQDIQTDGAWNRLTHTLFKKMPGYLVQTANARKSINGRFQGRR